MAAERREFSRALRKQPTKAEESRGVSVIRFANVEVENDLDSVLARIRAALRLPFD